MEAEVINRCRGRYAVRLRPLRLAWLAAAALLGLASGAAVAGAHEPEVIAPLAVATVTAAAPAVVTANGTVFAPAAVLAAPGLRCDIAPTGGQSTGGQPTGSQSGHSATVLTDADGYARFYAVPDAAGSPPTKLALACTDAHGQAASYSVDLADAATFAPPPLDLAREPGVDRAALTGNPLDYPQAALLRAGYGLRPDPRAEPAGYARWLAAASRPARLLGSRKLAVRSLAVNQTTAVPWTGSALTGKTNYVAVEGNLSVPGVIPDGDQTGDTRVAIWNGLSGLGTGSGLLLGGYQIDVAGKVVTYQVFRDYCCGNPKGGNYSGSFSPRPGDTVYSQEWYCDAKGNLNLAGGYGCTHLHDLQSGAILDCSSATGKTCPSVPALPLCSVSPGTPNCEAVGQSAEFIMTLEGPAFPAFTSELTLTGSAYSSQTGSYSQTISTDPQIYVLNDFTTTTSHLSVSLGTTDQTYFSVSQFKLVSNSADTAPAAQSLAVGPSANGLPLGNPWMLSNSVNAHGDHAIYHLVNGSFVAVPGGATQIAVSPGGNPWVIDHSGTVSYWNGTSFTPAPGNNCATHIAVGASTAAMPFGDPWVTGCQAQSEGYNIYRLQGSAWVLQPGVATALAIGPQGPWAVNKSGAVYYWDGTHYRAAPGSPCATGIAVAPIATAFNDTFGDVWITGCNVPTTGYDIYQLQGTSWVLIPGRAIQISVSPDAGVPWIVNSNGEIFE